MKTSEQHSLLAAEGMQYRVMRETLVSGEEGAEPRRENRHGEKKSERERCLRGNGTGKKKPGRVKAEEMERTGEMGERMFEIKRKQSPGRDGRIDNMKQQQRDELGHGEKGESRQRAAEG